LWCAYALHYDVAYLAEPMVLRRMHEQNLTKFFQEEGRRTHVANMLEVPWQMQQESEAAGFKDLARLCRQAVIKEYIAQLSSNSAQTGRPGMTWDEFEQSLQHYAIEPSAAVNIRAKVLAGIGDAYYWGHHLPQAGEYYRRALQEYPWMPHVYAKSLLMRSGRLGTYLRRGLAVVRRSLSALHAIVARSS